jgi:hypothetical protein
MEEHILKRLIYAKSLLVHGIEHADVGTPIDVALAILHFDNSIEMLMRTILESLSAPDNRERTFDDLINNVKNVVKIKKPKIDSDELLKVRDIKNLHLARNMIQHLGIIPAADEVRRYRILTEKVMMDIASELFGTPFPRISLGTLIRDETVRKLYTKADKAFSIGNYRDGLIHCVAAFETAKNMEQDRIYGSGFTFKRLSAESGKKVPKEIIEYMDTLAEEIEVMKLRLDYKKYQKYRGIFSNLKPFLRIAGLFSQIDERISKTEEILGDEMNEVDQGALKEHARFCLNFTIESILRWESVPRKAWYDVFKRSP